MEGNLHPLNLILTSNKSWGAKPTRSTIVAGVMSWRDKSQREGTAAHSDRNASRTMRKEPGSLPKYYQVCQQV
jgi:hypothetical protein